MELGRDMSSSAEHDPFLYAHEDGPREQHLTRSPDAFTIDSIYDANILYSQAWNDNEDDVKLASYNNLPPVPFSVLDGVTMDVPPFPSHPDEQFQAPAFHSPLPPAAEFVDSLNGSSPSNDSTTPNRGFNSPFVFDPHGREINLDHDIPSSSLPNYLQKPTYSSSTQPSLPRRRSRYFMTQPRNQESIFYDANQMGLDPMQRWQVNAPENEPASVTAIINAMQETPVVHRAHQQSRGRGRGRGAVSSRSRRSASATSRGSSVSSTDSAWSSASVSSRSRARRPHIRFNTPKTDSGKPRIFCCTFCCDRFGTRYEWVRHEKSLHLNLEAWYCAPLGPSVLSLITGKEFCAYCNEIEPSQEHLSMHNYDACQDLDNEHRSFRRKDHLVQHLRHVHQVQEIPPLDDWKKEMKDFSSRCGFCDQALDNWDSRVSHLSQHFRKGLTMKDWKGDHGFPPHIVAQLRNAYPPYLLGWESECMIPFSATNADVGNQYAHLMSGADLADLNGDHEPAQTELAGDGNTSAQLPQFLDIFTRHLSQYARRQMELGITPTDEMFQREARKVLFDSEDAWDQTIADSPDWLSAFRRLHLHPTGNSVNIT